MSTVPPPGFVVPDVKLIESDGMPLESYWHVLQIPLLLDIIYHHFADREDFFAGGNQFIYFDEESARNRNFLGPDFYYVDGVPRRKERLWWAIWEEDFHYPDVIVELLSQSTAVADRTTKKTVYERTFRTHEYFCYDPVEQRLEGWRLGGKRGRYREIRPDVAGRLWCEKLGLSLGIWTGECDGKHDTWLRFFDEGGVVIPTAFEAEKRLKEKEKENTAAATRRADAEKKRADEAMQRADAEKQRADAEKQRADEVIRRAEDEIARLRAELAAAKQRRDEK